MNICRVKHIPTGLYYSKSRKALLKYTDKDGKKREIYVKSNLSKKGRIYHGAPAERWYVGKIYNHVSMQKILNDTGNEKDIISSWGNFKMDPAPSSDWIVEEYVTERCGDGSS